MIGMTSQRDACSGACADELGCLRRLREASGGPSGATPTHHLILYVRGTRATNLSPLGPRPVTAWRLNRLRHVRRGG